MENHTLIDWEQLDAIADGWDPDFVEIYREFEQELPADLLSLRDALASGDAEAVARAAHRAKGCAANFGFERVREKMLAIETQARAGDISQAAALLDEAFQACGASCDLVRRERLSEQAVGLIKVSRNF